MEKILSKSLLAIFAACLVTASFVACSDDSNDTPATTPTTPSSGNGENTTSDNDGTTGSSAEAKVTVKELAFGSTTLNNKVYSYVDDNDETCYLTFTGGNCYESYSPEDIGVIDNYYTIISYNNKIYVSVPATRTSGSGLFATFTEDYDDDIVFKFKSDGTGTYKTSREAGTFTFTNKAGVVTISYDDGVKEKALYNGTKLYLVNDEDILTYIGNYSAN
ncbi:MAG: hypothetical protein K6B43_12800 [Treponema sp.]|nr:hypothetical protein [Treponema sp.]